LLQRNESETRQLYLLNSQLIKTRTFCTRVNIIPRKYELLNDISLF
jgi:hypothetical protein